MSTALPPGQLGRQSTAAKMNPAAVGPILHSHSACTCSLCSSPLCSCSMLDARCRQPKLTLLSAQPGELRSTLCPCVFDSKLQRIYQSTTSPGQNGLKRISFWLKKTQKHWGYWFFAPKESYCHFPQFNCLRIHLTGKIKTS